MNDYDGVIGTELDRLVAEKVFGWTDLRLMDSFGTLHRYCGVDPEFPCQKVVHFPVPYYSTNIACAMKVVDRLVNWEELELALDVNSSISCALFVNTKARSRFTSDHYDKNPARAICLAALEAKETLL